jgi:hypothetical protein
MVKRYLPVVLIVGVLLALVFSRVGNAQDASTDQGGMGSCTTNSLGYCTVPHSLGAVPTEIQVTGRSPIGGTYTLGQMLADTPTGSSFRVRAISASGNPIANQAITFWWHVWASGTATTVQVTTTTAPSSTTGPPTTTTAPPTTAPPPTTSTSLPG